MSPIVAAQDESALYLAASPHTREQVLARSCPVPATAGVYGWWFRKLPAAIETSGCAKRDGLTLLYTGISPSKPPTNGKAPSTQNIRKRVKTHYTGNAAGSTLRLTLGCLIADEIGIELRRVGSGERCTFHTGETLLSKWMAENALVSWIAREEPWELEDQLIASLDVPLNLDGNSRNSFYLQLKAARADAKRRAKELQFFPIRAWAGGKPCDSTDLGRFPVRLSQPCSRYLVKSSSWSTTSRR